MMNSPEMIARFKKIESECLRVCEYCQHFTREKMICNKTNHNVGLFSYCDDFEKNPNI